MDSGPLFTGFASPNAGIIVLFPIFDILSRSGDIRDQNFTEGKGKFFRGGPPNFWTCIIKLTHRPHVAKFCGDRPTELVDPVAN